MASARSPIGMLCIRPLGRWARWTKMAGIGVMSAMLFCPGQKAQPAAASAAAWPPQAMESMPMQMLVIDPMTKAAYGLQTLTQQTPIAKPKRETSSSYWTVYNFFASQSHHK
jgi:hypothetical protein